MADFVIHPAFAQLGDLEYTIGNRFRQGKAASQVGLDLIVEQPLEFKRHAGQDEDNPSGVFDNKGRGCAVRVFNRDGALGNVGLAFVVGRHDKAAAAEALIDLFQQPRIADQLTAADFGHHLAGQVILGRTQAAAGNHNIGAVQGPAEDLFHPPGVVAHNRLVKQIHPDVGQPLGDPGRVGVHNLAQQEF